MGTSLQLAELKEGTAIFAPDQKLYFYQGGLWLSAEDQGYQPEGEIQSFSRVDEDEGYIFRTHDGVKWMFTFPNKFQRLPSVLRSSRLTIR